jgi:hypothetical protein
MIGSKFGLWTVEREAAEQEKIKNHKSRSYICICECGGRYAVRGDQLNRGRSKGCKECYAKKFKKAVTKHKMIHTSTYTIWRGIKKRCNLPSHPSYESYGGRGITYCKEWEKFENFLRDMGERPEGMQIDRIDNNGNYEPSNCRWVTPLENSKNKRPMKPRKYQKPRCSCGNKLTNHATQCWDCYSKSRFLEKKQDPRTGKFIKQNQGN